MIKYFDLAPLWRAPAFLKIALSLRSDGKSTQCGLYALKTFNETGKRSIYLRRYFNEFNGEFQARFYDDLQTIDKVYKGDLLKGRKFDFGGSERKKELYGTLDGVRCIDFEAVTTSARHKSSYNYSTNRHIFFDEYMTLDGSYYRGDTEIIMLLELYKTVDRRHNDNNIVICGNTIDKYCPLFAYFGIPVDSLKSNKILSFRDGKMAILIWQNANNIENDRQSDIGILTQGTSYGNYNNGGYLISRDAYLTKAHTKRVICHFTDHDKYYTAYEGNQSGEIVFDVYNPAAVGAPLICVVASTDRRAIMLRAAPTLRDILQAAKDLNRLKFANEEVMSGCMELYGRLYK